MKSVVRWMLRATFSPPRCTYKANDTVSVITTGSSIYYRTIFEFTSPKGEKIMSSIWRDQSEEHPSKCLIYLHSLGANQFEAINIIPAICIKDLCIVTFDFPGCGLSDGTILPLDGSGAKLVKSCVDFLTQAFHFTEFAIWGRSMGAAVALHTVSTYPDMFKCIVADSSFACTEKILKDQGRANGFPSFLVSMLMPIIRKEAKEDLKTNVDVPFPIEYVQNAKAPLLQGHGNKDRFVPCEHAKLIFDRYGGSDKQLNFFEGKHNSPRPNSWYETATRFIYRHLRIEERFRSYDYIYHVSKLHVGPVDQVLPDVLRVKEVLRQRNLHRQSVRHASIKINNSNINNNNDNTNNNDNNINNNDNNINNNDNNDQNNTNDDANEQEYYDDEYDNQASYASDNDYDYNYDYDYDENQSNAQQQSGNIESNQIHQSNTNNEIITTHSYLIPNEEIQNINQNINENPIENSSVDKGTNQQIKTIDEHPTQKNDTELMNKKQEKKNKEDKKKRHRKVWFDSLSEIGTDIDLGEKINNLNREEEKRRREEFMNSVNGFQEHHQHHRHRYHRHHRHHRRIPLSSTRQSYSKTNSRPFSNAGFVIKKENSLEKIPKINKAGSALMKELPLDQFSDSDN